MKQVTKAELLAKMDQETHARIEEAIRNTGATHLVLFENQDMCSSALGDRTALCVGPRCTYKSPADCEGHWLHDLPSRRQYPVEWCEV